MRGWSSDLRFQRRRNSLLEWGSSRQQVQKCVTSPGDIDNSLTPHAFVDSDDKQDFEYFLPPETWHGEGFGKTSSYMDVRRYDCRNNFLCMHMQRQVRDTAILATMEGFIKQVRRNVDHSRL